MAAGTEKARIIGLLYLLGAVIGIGGLVLNGMPFSFEGSPKVLVSVAIDADKIHWSILCDFVANAVLVAVAVLLYSIVKSLNRSMAVWYLGLSLIGFSVNMIGSINVASMVSVSHDFVKQGSYNPSFYQALAMTKQEDFFGAHFMSLIVYSLAAVPLYWSFYKWRLIPRILSIWGLIAAILVMGATWCQIFDQEVSLFFYLPNGLFILFLGFWLLIKGFSRVENNEKVEQKI